MGSLGFLHRDTVFGDPILSCKISIKNSVDDKSNRDIGKNLNESSMIAENVTFNEASPLHAPVDDNINISENVTFNGAVPLHASVDNNINIAEDLDDLEENIEQNPILNDSGLYLDKSLCVSDTDVSDENLEHQEEDENIDAELVNPRMQEILLLRADANGDINNDNGANSSDNIPHEIVPEANVRTDTIKKADNNGILMDNNPLYSSDENYVQCGIKKNVGQFSVKKTDNDGNVMDNDLVDNSHKITCNTASKKNVGQASTKKSVNNGNVMDNKLQENYGEITYKAASKNNARKPSFKGKTQRQERLCIYCGKYFAGSKLRRHLENAHKGDKEVKEAIDIKKKKEKDAAFLVLISQGILKHNMNEASKDQPKYQASRTGNPEEPLGRCSHCFKTLQNKNFAKHRKTCAKMKKLHPKNIEKIPMDVSNLSVNVSADFEKYILRKFHDDKISRQIKNDEMLLKLGNVFYTRVKRKQDKRVSARKSLRSELRMLSKLYLSLKKAKDFIQEEGNITDMFFMHNFTCLRETIDEHTTKEDGSLKAGLKQNLYYLIKRAAKTLRALMIEQRNRTAGEEIKNFLEVFEMWDDLIFGDAVYENNNRRQIYLRRPEQLPDENDVRIVREHILTRIRKLTDDFNLLTNSEFVELRDVVYSRLLIINGRRDSEPTRILVKDWLHSRADGWIPEDIRNQLDDFDKILIKKMKVSYVAGKGNNHQVPVVFPPDTYKALDILSTMKIRNDCGVNPENDYLFPGTKGSEEHASGWHSLHRIIDLLPLKYPKKLKSDTNRHRICTIFASIDLTDQERKTVYKHMGHSEKINSTIYQSPLVLQHLRTVGKTLIEIDEGYHVTQKQGTCSKSKDSQEDVLTSMEDEASSSGYHVSQKKGSCSKTKDSQEDVLTSMEYEASSSESNQPGTESESSNESEPIPNLGKRKKHTRVIKAKRKKRRTHALQFKGNYDDDSMSDSEKELSISDKLQRKQEDTVKKFNLRSKSRAENPLKRKYCPTSDEESCSENETPVDTSRKNFRWTRKLIKSFDKQFKCYVTRTADTAMPSRKDMEEYLKTSGCKNVGFEVVRNRINNERKKNDERKKKRLSEMNII